MFIQSANINFYLCSIRRNLGCSKILCMCVLEKEIGKDIEKEKYWCQISLIKTGLSNIKQDSSQSDFWEFIMYLYVLWPSKDKI